MCIGLVVACHQQQNVRREVWPPSNEPTPVVAEAPAPPSKVLDPVIVELPERSTVMQVRKQLDKENPGRARELAEAAGRTMTHTKTWKKAIVVLQEDHHIDLF